MNLYAVSLTGWTDGGWLVEADGPEAAVAVVRGTVPDVRECERGEFVAWPAAHYRARFLGGDDFGPGWTRLAERDS